jgi:predicted MFS family arabinose efflux permease
MADTIIGTDQDKFKWGMLAMVLLGVGEILGCFIIGNIVDRFGSKTAIIFNLVCLILMIFSTIWYIIVFKFNYMAWIMCFLWGFTDSTVNINT